MARRLAGAVPAVTIVAKLTGAAAAAAHAQSISHPLTPWFHLTADLQIVEPADRANDTVIVLGLRANMKL